MSTTESDSYICLEHNHAACPECVKEFRALETKNAELEQTIRRMEAALTKISKEGEFRGNGFMETEQRHWVATPAAKIAKAAIEPTPSPDHPKE